MVDPSLEYKFSQDSFVHSNAKFMNKQISKSRQKIESLSEKLIELKEQRQYLLVHKRLPQKKFVPVDGEENRIAQGCKRAFNRVIQLFSKSNHIEKVPTIEEIDADIKNTQSSKNRLEQELSHIITVQDKGTEILNALRGTNPEKILNKIMKSTPKELFGDAIQQVFKHPLKKEYKIELRKFLCSKFPSASKNHVCYDVNLKLRFLLPQGCSVVVDHLKKQQNPEKDAALQLQTTVLEDPDLFVSYVSNSQQNSDDPPEVLLVRCQSLDRPVLSAHITPLLIKQIDENNVVLIWTDSVSTFGYLERELVKIKENLDLQGKKLNLFCLPNSRQSTAMDCSTFSLQDAITFSKHHEDLLQQCKRVLDKEDENFDQSIEFPKRFFWITQKSKLAEAVMENMSGEELEEFTKKYEEYNVEVTPGVKHNLRADRIGDKYEGIIWRDIINTQKPAKSILSFLKH